MQIVGIGFVALNVGSAIYSGMTGDPGWAAFSGGVAAFIALQTICYAIKDARR